jgi:hypothetical protein
MDQREQGMRAGKSLFYDKHSTYYQTLQKFLSGALVWQASVLVRISGEEILSNASVCQAGALQRSSFNKKMKFSGISLKEKVMLTI